jgi:hypothetical protein
MVLDVAALSRDIVATWREFARRSREVSASSPGDAALSRRKAASSQEVATLFLGLAALSAELAALARESALHFLILQHLLEIFRQCLGVLLQPGEEMPHRWSALPHCLETLRQSLGDASYRPLLRGKVHGGDLYGQVPTLAVECPDYAGDEGRWAPPTCRSSSPTSAASTTRTPGSWGERRFRRGRPRAQVSGTITSTRTAVLTVDRRG